LADGGLSPYPELKIDQHFYGSLVDIVREGFDRAIRGSRNPGVSSLVATRPPFAYSGKAAAYGISLPKRDHRRY